MKLDRIKEILHVNDHKEDRLAVEEYYGERCPDYDADCVVCVAWKMLDDKHPEHGPVSRMKPPEAIKWELELCMFGNAAGGLTPADENDDVVSWDVELHLRFEQTGQIEVLFERTYDNANNANDHWAILDDMFDVASHNIQPDE